MHTKHFLVAALICGLAAMVMSQSNLLDTNMQDKVSEIKDKLNSTEVESIKNKTELVFQEKCEKNGGAEAYDNSKKAIMEVPTCLKEKFQLEDPEILKAEIKAAKPNGTVDEVFKKYCQRMPEAKTCFNDALEAVKPCFGAEEQDNLNTVHNVTEQLADFICYKDGDRIALFIAEGGPECIQSKQEQIQECVRSVYGAQLNVSSDNITAAAIPEIKFGEKECGQLNALQACVVHELEGCPAPTCANIVEALFKFARKATPCKNFGESEAKPRSQVQEEPVTKAASSISVATSALLLAVAIALY